MPTPIDSTPARAEPASSNDGAPLDPVQRLMPRLLKVMNWITGAIAVLVVVLMAMIGRDLVHRSHYRHQGFQNDLAALHLNGRLPAITDVSVTSRERRPAITTVTFATGQSVTLNASHRWIYLKFPWSQWDQAVALQRESDRRVRQGESGGVPVNDDGTVNRITGLPTSGPNGVVAWNAPLPDCDGCDRATLADGTTLSVSSNDRTILLAVPLSMLPEVLALPGTPSRPY